MSLLLRSYIYDVICMGAWQTVYAMLHQFFNDIRNFFKTQTCACFTKRALDALLEEGI